ncbi:hypothetical protein HG1285_10592, partial [Hydrogenivirga sp. 128-5-R1-1]
VIGKADGSIFLGPHELIEKIKKDEKAIDCKIFAFFISFPPFF